MAVFGLSAHSSTRLSALFVLLFLVMTACAPRPPVETPPAPPPEVIAPLPEPEPDGPVSTRLDRFCGAVQRIVDAQEGGFVGLRSTALGGDAWAGSVVPEGMSGCTIDGQLSYACLGPRVQRGNGSTLQTSFSGFAADLDACFARGVWFPRNWHRGDLVEFAGVEQQQVWRDVSAERQPAVALAIEEDFIARIYAIRMTVQRLP
jgi:hypothetical protein